MKLIKLLVLLVLNGGCLGQNEPQNNAFPVFDVGIRSNDAATNFSDAAVQHDGGASDTRARDTELPGRCGDGLRQGDEACDDGNDEDQDACLTNCLAARCGDGIRRLDLAEGSEGYEGCDDGNEWDTDDCPSTCTPAFCGDGFLHSGVEGCDAGPNNGRTTCGEDCTPRCQTHRGCHSEDAKKACRSRRGEFGVCQTITQQRCAVDTDCLFEDHDGALWAHTCHRGNCRLKEDMACRRQADCPASTWCNPGENPRLCSRNCRNANDCPLEHTICSPHSNRCVFNLCGQPSENSRGFAGVNNGRLHRGCADSESSAAGSCFDADFYNEHAGACFAGGDAARDQACLPNAPRDLRPMRCAAGLRCLEIGRQGGRCTPACSLRGAFGAPRPCPAGLQCVASDPRMRTGLCVPQELVCRVQAGRPNCPVGMRCALARTDENLGRCRPIIEAVEGERVCHYNHQCADGQYCHTGSRCRNLCLTQEQCGGGERCFKALQELPYGFCVAAAP